MKKFSMAVVLATASAISYVNPAHAVTATLSTGVTRNNVTNEGSFSSRANQTIIDFNSGTAPTTGFATYSGITGVSSIRADQYAPAGPAGQTNTSNYLAVFQGNAVTINFASPGLRYFGIDLGSVDPATDQLQFYNGNTLLNTFTGSSLGIADQASRYAEFTATGTANDPFFNRVVLTKTGTGGFETDNHSYVAAPEPSNVLSSLAFGALGAGYMLRRKLKNQKAVSFKA